MFGNKVKEKRTELNLSQTKLARMIEIPESTLSDIELGKRYPWPKVRRALSQVLGIAEEELFPHGN